MTDLEDRIKNPRFNNWVKSALTLVFARDAVKEFVEKEIKMCHESLIQSISAACSSCDFRTCGQCMNITCTNETLKNGIKDAHNKSTPTFDNTNPKDCWSNSSEFAKCFMPQNAYGKVKDADETDLPGLISVIINNLDLRKKISDKDTQFIKVKQVRNEIKHNPRFDVDDETFKEYTEAIRKMLFCIQRTVKVKSALTRIDGLSNGSILITMKDIAHVINEAIASLQQLSNEIKDAIPDMSKLSHRFTQEIENETKKGVKSLKIKVNDGVIILEQKTTGYSFPDHDTHTDFEKRLMELSGTVRELKSRQRKVCPFDNLDVGLEYEKIYSITGMTKVNVDFLVVVDKLNSRVKLCNVRSNNIISFVDIDNPFDI